MSPSIPIRVAVIEDQDDFRQSLCAMLSNNPLVMCVSDYSSAEDALAALPNESTDVVLTDIGLPHMSGIDCIRVLRHSCPTTQFIMLTVFEDTEKIFTALQAGASGYLLKSSTPEKICESICEVHAGGSAMSSQIARKVISFYQQQHSPTQSEKLSPREQDVVEFLAKGLSYKEIATALFISAETVRRHIHKIYEKLHVRNRTEALAKLRDSL